MEDVKDRIVNESAFARGQVLHYFAVFEAYMSQIIRENLFSSEKEYEQLIPLFVRGNMSTPLRDELFKHCLKKLTHRVDKDEVDFILKNFGEALSLRHCCAHWMLDIRAISLIHFEKTGNFSLLAEKDKNPYIDEKKRKFTYKKINEWLNMLQDMNTVVKRIYFTTSSRINPITLGGFAQK